MLNVKAACSLHLAASHVMPPESSCMSGANRRLQACSSHACRRGSLSVEMIMVVVVLAIVTVGIAQFGVFFANADEVAFAARVGVEEASQTANLPPTSGPVPANIVSAIEHQLQSSQINWLHIRLEHNVN